MAEILPQLGLVAFLVLLNAAFAGTELALVSLREGQLQRLERQSASGAILAKLAREPNRFLATIQIGITLAGFLASAAAAVSLAEPLEGPLSFLGRAAGPASIFVVTLILSYLTLVFGELAPKRLAMQRAEKWGLVAARPLALTSKLTRPAVWLLSRSTDLVVSLLGGDPTMQREEVTEEELRDMVTGQPQYTEMQRTIFEGAFEISERRLQEIVRPRTEVYSLHADTPASQALWDLTESGYSRAPVRAGGSLDDVVGWVHVRDLVTAGDQPVVEVSSKMRAYPESLGVLDLLREMQVGRFHMAIVVNEHGGVEGIVTMEDLIEELVGEIYDEADRDVLEVQTEPDGTLIIPGSFPIHDLGDLGIDDIPEGNYATVAGLVIEQLNEIPDSPGARVTIADWEFEVTAVGRRTITELRVRPVVVPDAVEPESSPPA